MKLNQGKNNRFSTRSMAYAIVAVSAAIPSVSALVAPVYQAVVIPSGDPALIQPYQGFYDSAKDRILVADASAQKYFSVKDGSKVIFAGGGNNLGGIDGPATSAAFSSPSGVWSDTQSNVFVSDRSGGNLIRKVSPTGQITNFAGSGVVGSSGDGGPATSARFKDQTYLCGDTNGNLFVSEYGSQKIRKVSKTNIISTVVGGGSLTADGSPATSSDISGVDAVYVNANGDIFWTTWSSSKVQMMQQATQQVTLLAGGGAVWSYGFDAIPSRDLSLFRPFGLWGDSQDNIFVAVQGRGNVVMITKASNYATSYKVVDLPGVDSVYVDKITDKVYVTQISGPLSFLTVIDSVPLPNSVAPSTSPSTSPTVAPTIIPSGAPTAVPSVTPSSAPSQQPTLAVPEYSLTVSAKSFKYFEVRVFTEANERVFPVSYELMDCPENADAVIWGHESTPITEDTNTCVYGLPRHYWCECPALVNGNKPKLTLNFGGTVFDRVELLILDWVDGEVVVSDSANNIVLFSALRAGGPLVGEEFVGYDHLNLLQIAPSVVPTIVPSSLPTVKPSGGPTTKPTPGSIKPTQTPTVVPTTTAPSAVPSISPSIVPSAAPSFTAQYTITLTAKTFKYFEVRVYTHDNLRIFPVSYELEHCPENAGIAVWNEQTTEDTNTCVYGYPRNFWCECAAVADAEPKLVLHMGHTVFDRVELLLLNWEDGEVTVADEANHETFLSATHDGVGNEFVTFGNLNLEHATAPLRRLLRGA